MNGIKFKSILVCICILCLQACDSGKYHINNRLIEEPIQINILSQQFTLFEDDRYQFTAEIEIHNRNDIGIEGYLRLTMSNTNLVENVSTLYTFKPENQSCFLIDSNSTCVHNYELQSDIDRNLSQEFRLELISAEYVITNYILN